MIVKAGTNYAALLALCLSLGFAGCDSSMNGKPTPKASKRILKLRGYNFDEKSFLSAVVSGDVIAVNTFIAAGIDPNVKAESGSSALILAASRGDLEVVKALLRGGANVNQRDDQGFTALLRALQRNDYEVADLLVDQPNLDVNVVGTNSVPVLTSYVVRQRDDVVGRLLSRGANVNLPDQDGDTALHAAMQRGSLNLVQALLSKGANPNAKNKLGGTPLMWAGVFGRDEVVRELLRNGADPTLKDADGITASAWAAKNGQGELAQFLREAEKNPQSLR